MHRTTLPSRFLIGLFQGLRGTAMEGPFPFAHSTQPTETSMTRIKYIDMDECPSVAFNELLVVGSFCMGIPFGVWWLGCLLFEWLGWESFYGVFHVVGFVFAFLFAVGLTYGAKNTATAASYGALFLDAALAALFLAVDAHDDLLHPSAFYEYMKVLEDKDAWFIYSDEATFRGESINNMVTLHFKPDFAPDNLRANNYICHLSAFKRELVDKVGRFRSECDGSQDHDLILRLTHEAIKHGDGVVHVPHILYYWRSHAGSTAADINAKTYAINAAKKAVASSLESDGFTGFEIESSKAFATIFRIRYRLVAKPLVSIVIPNREHEDDLRRCIDSILTRTSYENYEIVIVENGSTSQGIRDYYEELKKAPCIKIVEVSQDKFNYSELINKGAAASSGEYLILLNNDTEVITRSWIEELLMYAQRPDVGAVGCKLYYPDHSIQHAGVVIGLGAHRTAGHVHYKLASTNLGYMGRLCYAQNFTAVTGACLMVSRADFDACGGLDEGKIVKS